MGLLSAIYGFGLSCRRFHYLYFKKPNRLPARVVSIGNVTLGGTGKTPAVISVANEAKKRGHNPCILTRGYRGKASDITFVSRGEGALVSPAEAGDEAVLMAERLSRVTIIKGKDRFRAGTAAFDNAQLAIVNLQVPTLFILDDGFQHWRLHRDVDIVLVDATNPFGNEKLFPEGIMRESFDALGRAHIIVITKADMAASGAVTEITRKVRRYNKDASLYTSVHKPALLVNADGVTRDLRELCNKSIYAISGIANPTYFESVLASIGVQIARFQKYRDHYAYNQKDVNRIRTEFSSLDVITTEKDLVKLREFELPQNIWALRIEFSIDDDFYDDLFRRLQ